MKGRGSSPPDPELSFIREVSGRDLLCQAFAFGCIKGARVLLLPTNQELSPLTHMEAELAGLTRIRQESRGTTLVYRRKTADKLLRTAIVRLRPRTCGPVRMSEA